MGDFLRRNIPDLFHTTFPVIKTIPRRFGKKLYRLLFPDEIKTIPRKFRKKLYYLLFPNKADNTEKINKTTIRYKNIISKILNNYYGNDWDNAINHVFYNLSKLSKKEYINYDEDFFDQLMEIIEFLHEKIKINHIFNTLNSSGLKEFYNKTIGMKLKYLAYNGSSCRHHTLLFKHILDEIESRTKLGISSYFFIEKTNGLNHAGLVVSFNGKDYLIDSSFFNRKYIQSFDDLGEAYERMHELPKHYSDSLDKDTETILLHYKNSKTNYFKVCVNSPDDLIYIISSLIEDRGVVRTNKNMFQSGNIIDNLIYRISFELFGNGILFSDYFFYHFNEDFDVENLDNLENENLLRELINNISYKIDAKGNKIGVFKFEKEYLLSRLLYFSDKIDYNYLRKILKKTKGSQCNNFFNKK